MTLAVDPDQMAEAKKMIRNFRDQFTETFGSTQKKEVYKLMIQFIPLTKEKNTK